MRKKEEGNCIGGEIVDIGALEHQIHGAQAELQQQQEEIHLEKIKFIAYGQLSTPQPWSLLLNGLAKDSKRWWSKRQGKNREWRS